MTESSRRCAICDRPLRPDDQFCAACGTPTSSKVDLEATLVTPTGSERSRAAPGDSDVTAPSAEPEPFESLSGAEFTAHVRGILGAAYDVLSLVGQGGFARVYKARDRRLDRIVAIKVIRPDLVGKEWFVASFRNEGIALAKLRHPGIVPIYDIRERGGLIYYVMPFVQGTTLQARLARGRLPPFESRRILSELTEALAAAHRAKMVHRDIKPANVFLEGDLGKVLLMDFGTAVALTKSVEEGSREPVVGTPEYMSPEQARGLPEIDHRSDIYSLGALGYRMLMGRPPFSGRSAAEILEKHVADTPVPIRDINPTIPKDFADAIMRCLAKDPWERFPTAKELGTVLESVSFPSTREMRRPREELSGVHAGMVVLIAAVALIAGVFVGLALS